MSAARRTGAAVSDADRAQLQTAERVIREQGAADLADALFAMALDRSGLVLELTRAW